VSGLDPRRFQLVAAVLDRAGVPCSRAELFGATAGAARVDDPACDLAVAAALASAATGVPTPPASAFVGEVGLTGRVRPSPAMARRLAAARTSGIRTVFGPAETRPPAGVRLAPVTHLADALTWAGVGSRASKSANRASDQHF
jgi:DNA repair protein RadA/Sms